MTEKHRKAMDQKIYKWGIVLITVIVILLLLSMCHGSFGKEGEVVLVLDYAPRETEENIEAIPGDTEAGADGGSGGSVRLIYSDRVTIDLSRAEASLYFGNPGRSNQNMVLRVMIRDEVIAQSGLIPAGYELETLALRDAAVSKLRPGGYNGVLVIYYYDQDTEKLAAVNTEIPIDITVEE